MKIADLLTLLEKVQPRVKGFNALCPAHEDHTPSLSVAEGDRGGLYYTAMPDACPRR